MVYGFGADTSLSFSLHMNVGSFRIADPAETSALDAVATMAKSMGWLVEESILGSALRAVTVRAFYGHANIPDFIEALNTGLLAYRLRVISAEPVVKLDAEYLIRETMTLKFGW